MSERTVELGRLALTLVLAVFVVGSLVTAEPPEVDRARRIGERIRCPVCSGESIADSPNPLATDMMEMVRWLVAEGHDDEQVIEAVIAGYDDAQRLDPPFTAKSIGLWAIPLVALVGGVVVMLGRRRAPGSS